MKIIKTLGWKTALEDERTPAQPVADKLQMDQRDWIRVGRRSGWLKSAGRSRSWSGVYGNITVELYIPEETNEIVEEGNDTAVPNDVSAFIMQHFSSLGANPSDHTMEISIDYESSGYYDPGVHTLSNGDPGYPPEGEDERIVNGATLIIDGKTKIQMPKELFQTIQERWGPSIDDDDLDTSDVGYDEPEYDPMDEIERQEALDRDYNPNDYQDGY
tara:strand:- start:1193 stop:1840 length:648 start_codon:yes stop_codon:yes gene_type:complete